MGTTRLEHNIALHLANAAKHSPNQTAIITAKSGQHKPRSFQDLYQDVQYCSSFLKAKGISKGDQVLLAVKPGYQLILISFSLFFLGAIPIIIDPGMGLSSFLRCIKNTQPSALIGIPLMHIIGKFFPNNFRSIQKKVLIRSNKFLKQIEGHKNTLIEHPENSLENEVAAIVFTSGSTGPPKGVVYTHKVFNAQINHLKNDFKIKNGEIDLATLPIFALFNPALGVTSVIPNMNPRKPSTANSETLVQTIQEFNITTSFASPIIGQKIFSFCKSRNITLPKINRFFLAGAPSHPNLIGGLSKIIPNGKVIIPYGATEALPISAADNADVKSLAEDIALGNGSCLGRVLHGNKVRILPITFSPFESGVNCPRELPQGQVGEICVSGSVVSKEYFRMPGATFDSKFNDGKLNFHRMGDLGYYDKNGFLRFLGRKAERILTVNGPLETERCEPVINAIKGVSRSALIGLGYERIKKPCLVVELSKKTTKDETRILYDKIINELQVRLPEFTFKHVVFENSLPVDSRHNAKIHRLALAKKWTKRFAKKTLSFS